MRRSWLRPLVPLYTAGLELGNLFRKAPASLRHPVISIGNLSTGGTGKTPFTIALALLLKDEGFLVDVLSRGFGRTNSEVEWVNPRGNSIRFGDEPILIAQEAKVPVYVGESRLEAGKLAERQYARNQKTIHLLDDGFQHRRLSREVDIVLVNSEDLADTLLPAGNLREPLSALRRASAFAIATDDEPAVESLLSKGFGPRAGQPVWRFRRELLIPPEVALTPALAFCGIARPDQFFAGLEKHGVDLKSQHAFKDHHRFRSRDLALIEEIAERVGARALITTAKDKVRLGSLKAQLTAIAPLYVAGLSIQLEDPSALAFWLGPRISTKT